MGTSYVRSVFGLIQLLFLLNFDASDGKLGQIKGNTLSFLVIGDWGGLPIFPYRTPIETANAARIANLTEQVNATFVLALGDNFYFDGVKSVEDPRFQETYDSVFKVSHNDISWYLIAGNHDHHGNVSAQICYSSKEKRWNYPDFYYSLHFAIPGTSKSVDVVMVDTVILCGDSDHDQLHKQPEGPASLPAAMTQWNWIEDQLKNSRADYLLVAGHYPVYSIAEHGPTWGLVDKLMPMLYKYNVTAYLSGHDHNLQHLQYTRSNRTVDYFVSGAANFVDPSIKHKGDVPAGSYRFYWADLFSLGGLAYVQANEKNMTWTFVDAGGKQLYQRTMLPRK